jgi:hypothetical protein
MWRLMLQRDPNSFRGDAEGSIQGYFFQSPQYNAGRCLKVVIEASSCSLIEPKRDIVHWLSTRGQCIIPGELIEEAACLSSLWARLGYGLLMVHGSLRGGTGCRKRLSEALWLGSRPRLRIQNT